MKRTQNHPKNNRRSPRYAENPLYRRVYRRFYNTIAREGILRALMATLPSV